MSAECIICGGVRWKSSIAYGKQADLQEQGWCGFCSSMEITADNPPSTVIDGVMYSPGRATAGPNRGMAGRRFDIEYLADGRRITTFDLWYLGGVPERWRDRIPDTAKFINGASRGEVGGGACWGGSGHSTPPYPFPNAP